MQLNAIQRARQGLPITPAEWDKLPQWIKNRRKRPPEAAPTMLTIADQRRPVCQKCERFRGEAGKLSVHCGCKGNRPCSNLVRLDSECPEGKWKRKVLLRHWLSPGDVLVMSAAVRDLAKAHGGKLDIAVDTSAGEIWENNPNVRRMSKADAIADGYEVIDCKYPSIGQSNQSGRHFVQGFADDIGAALGLPLPLTTLAGDIHLSDEEKQWANQVEQDFGHKGPFWILMAPGGKNDFTAKWWNPVEMQKVVDHFKGRITFVRCGEAAHWHPKIDGTLDLIGKTKLRQFIRLMHHAEGVICPVTFAMHLAAAVETKTGKPRACVVIAGGREPATWEQYPGHEFLHSIGKLDCCKSGGCWKARAQQVGDGDAKDKPENLCPHRVEVDYPFTRKDGVAEKLHLPQCMADIKAEDVIAAVERQLSGDRTIKFNHGLGDTVYFAHQLQLYKRRGYKIRASIPADRNIIMAAAGIETVNDGSGQYHAWVEGKGFHEVTPETYMLANKAAFNLSRQPMPYIGEPRSLAAELSEVTVDIRPHISKAAMSEAAQVVRDLPRPLILMHSKGNSGQREKSIPDDVARVMYDRILERTGGSLFLLDWDNRVPRHPDRGRVKHLLDDWKRVGLDEMFALMSLADLLIGIDSGPMHASRMAGLKAIGIWRNEYHHPGRYGMPRPDQLNLVSPSRHNRAFRSGLNLVEFSGDVDASLAADAAARMVSPAAYLPPEQIGEDVQLQYMASRMQRDQRIAFDVMMRRLPDRPAIVETGCIRQEEDWKGAGYSSYVWGVYAKRRGGQLTSIDLSSANLSVAKRVCEGLPVTFVNDDSIAAINSLSGRPDAFYLDSLDTDHPKSAEHGLAEAKAAASKSHARTLIAFDDSPKKDGGWTGKGKLGIPWLIDNGWKVIGDGYQVVLQRAGESVIA